MPQQTIEPGRRQDFIYITGARENNLKNITVSIPKKQITVFTGVSGSGKSSLVFDTIAAESQRQLNETFSSFVRHRLPRYGQPDVDSLENLSVAMVIDQKRLGGNARSTVGTVTDIYALLRLLYSRIGRPFAGYSDVFSFNNPQGMCSRCEGLGTVASIAVHRLIDQEKSLNEGAIRFPTFSPGEWRWKRYALTGLFDNDKKLGAYTTDECDLLLYQTGIKLKQPHPGWPPTSSYEGLIPRIERSFLTKESKEAARYREAIDRIVSTETCPLCKGARLNQNVLNCRINGRNIADCTALQASDLFAVIRAIDAPAAAPVVAAILERLEHFIAIGLGYLSLSRETGTLSGGESQRVKMLRQLGSSLTDITYILDEPSTGLHPHDVQRLNTLIRQLCSKGNTVLVVEHDPAVIAIADHIIDLGPGAGSQGGEIIYEGNLAGLALAATPTGEHFARKPRLKPSPRQPDGWLMIEHATLHNLKDVCVKIPRGVMTVVTGVAGSGKSTLINGVLPRNYPEAIFIDQEAIRASKRSNPATYTGIFDQIRDLFAQANKVSASLFSFNSTGACPACKGLGFTYTDLAFMDPVISLCEVCQGRRFTVEVLGYTLRGKNIGEILSMSVAKARDLFPEEPIQSILTRLNDVGLDYITLGQPLNTLSGGERQRLKLAAELESSGQIYILDEPTTGLHMADTGRLIALLNRLTANGSTVIIIEHNLDVISQADWIIDLGPGAGQDGGKIIFAGCPKDLLNHPSSLTGFYLKQQTNSGFTVI
ncbi:daunorubicin resistance protein DrrC [Anaerosporomusa subterranea]|uniref:UvrABC system protein A n=1 Tax=Anaerosporomusa subterranea TaxID=1794912 RepID=A0A154BQE3_ANASB|nr:excinuclease ABC subunit UvrA [Anaerosporomusa subterranea]KYZ76156.1 daunorubicin resistance protein DrrC [Anaerosporomusa subterranea]